MDLLDMGSNNLIESRDTQKIQNETKSVEIDDLFSVPSNDNAQMKNKQQTSDNPLDDLLGTMSSNSNNNVTNINVHNNQYTANTENPRNDM